MCGGCGASPGKISDARGRCETAWGSTGSKEEHKDLRASQGSGRGHSKVPPLPRLCEPTLAQPVESRQATTASAFSPSPGPHAAGTPPPHSSCPPPWLSGSAAVLAAGGPGDKAPSSSPLRLTAPASLPAAAVITSSEISIGAQGAGPWCGARSGAGRVGGVKVGAQQNPPHLSEQQDLRCDLNTGGRARYRRDVTQSSPDAPQHIPGPPVEVSLHPTTREPSVPRRLPDSRGSLSQLRLC